MKLGPGLLTSFVLRALMPLIVLIAFPLVIIEMAHLHPAVMLGFDVFLLIVIIIRRRG